MKKENNKAKRHPVRKAICIVLVVVIALVSSLVLLMAHDWKEEYVKYETTNPNITELGTTLVSAHRSGGGIFPENTMTFLIVSIVIVSVFLSLLDIGALSRASTIFLIMVTLSVSVVVTSAFSNIETINIVPLFMNGEAEFIKQALAYSVFFPVA